MPPEELRHKLRTAMYKSKHFKRFPKTMALVLKLAMFSYEQGRINGENAKVTRLK